MGRRGWMGRSLFPVPPVLPIPPFQPKESPRQHFELARGRGSSPCITVAGEIYEVERLRGSPRDAIHIREPRLAGRRTGAGQALANQRVDQARFADVRPSDERDTREGVIRNIAPVGRTANECGFDSQ
jgi:hypothetical protein